ncbi:MAG: hypothetical protein DRP62_08920, partial [Planctomycetota bacterium]
LANLPYGLARQISALFIESSRKELMHKEEPISGARELLEELKQKGIDIYILSACEDRILKERINKHFPALVPKEHIIGTHIYEEGPTDKIEIAKDIIRTKGYNKNKVAMVGDGTYDMKVAKENNIIGIGFTNNSGIIQQMKQIHPEVVIIDDITKALPAAQKLASSPIKHKPLQRGVPLKNIKGISSFGKIDEKTTALAEVAEYQKAKQKQTAKYLEEIAKKGLIRAGPLEEGILSGIYRENNREYIVLSDKYPEYNISYERAASLAYEIGNLSKFNKSSSENKTRMRGYYLYLINKIEKEDINNSKALDSLKPWGALILQNKETKELVLSGAEDDIKNKVSALNSYYSQLQAATKELSRKGAFKFEPVNIRTGAQGYKWGPLFAKSYILKRLGVISEKGKILNREFLEYILEVENMDNLEEYIAERWFVTDDTKYPSWIITENVSVPLFWLLRHDPEGSLGKEHNQAYQGALGMVMKYLDAAEPLSWQVHIGITEGYVVLRFDDKTGLFLGVNKPETDQARKELIRRVKTMLKELNPYVVRMPDMPISRSYPDKKKGVEVSDIFLNNKLENAINKLLENITDDMSIAELAEYLMTEGANVVDIAGFGFDKNGRFHPEYSLVQSIEYKQDQRIVIKERAPHALYGYKGNTATLLELKATSTGPADERQSSSDQTWALADNLLGKNPRLGKVVLSGKKGLETAFAAIKQGKLWRPIDINEDLKHNADQKPIEIAEGITSQLLHNEEAYAGRRIIMQPETKAYLRRFGQHSAFLVREGELQIRRPDNNKLLLTLKKEEEGFVKAGLGDLILESTGTEPLELIDFKRPVKGVALPQVEKLGSASASK